MRQSSSFHIAVVIMTGGFLLLLAVRALHAESLSLLTDLKYELVNSEAKEKAAGNMIENERTLISQLYNLEIQKEIFPTLQLNAGGMFDQDQTDNTTTDPDGQDNDTTQTAVRPHLDLQFRTPLLRAASSYRTNETERKASNASTERTFNEEYRASMSWDPIELPEVDLDFTRTLSHNEPLTNNLQSDYYQLRSRYDHAHYRFSYNHTTNNALNKLTEFKTLTNSDDGAAYFSRTSLDNRVTVNSSLRGRQQQVEFNGAGERWVDTSSPGVVIGTRDDFDPLTSNPDVGFDLSTIDLLADSLLEARQLSFGLDFGTLTEVNTLLINFTDLGNSLSTDFPWRVYARDSLTENWTQLLPVQASTNHAEERFELSFSSVKTRYIKVVTTPLAPPVVLAGETLLISGLVAQRTLPPDIDQFSSADWAGALSVNWKISDQTATGYDILYRERRSEPFNEKRTLLTAGARLNHRFSNTYVGNLRAQHSEVRDRGEKPRTSHDFSAGLAASYLETFDQSLIYSFSHQEDETSQTSISNAIFLRTNLDLYQGWSMALDNGYSWQNPAEGADSNTTFARVSSNVVPNHWVNFSLSYGVSWTHEAGQQESRDQSGRLVATWVPNSSLSLSANLAYTDESGEVQNSTAEQQYFINWSPLRDGSLQFSLAYGQSKNAEDEESWTLSPTLRWQVNRSSILTLDYSVGERDDRIEVVAFNSTSLTLRVVY